MEKQLRQMSDLAIEYREKTDALRHTPCVIGGFDAVRSVFKGSPVISLKAGVESTRRRGGFSQAQRALCSAVYELLDAQILSSIAPVTVICLGNGELTADSLGALTAKHLIATRIPDGNESTHFSQALRPVSVLATGSSAQSGIDACEVIQCCMERLKPRAVITVDSLKASEPSSLCELIQLSTLGVTPGSGVKNSRKEISRHTLGIPVLSIGVPTAIASETLTAAALTEAGIAPENRVFQKVMQKCPHMTVCKNDIDIALPFFAELIGKSLNHTLLGFSEL